MTQGAVITGGAELAEKAGRLRDELTAAFTTVRAQVGETAEGLRSLIRMMDPYVNYFFSGEKGEDSFLGDVIVPAERDLGRAIDSAVEIMHGDSGIHETIYSSLSKTLLLQDYVQKIVELLEMMEIYSINTMINSAKAGAEGASLTTISTHMAALSRKGNDLSQMFTGKMDALRIALGDFSKLSERIELLHETNLTTIELSSRAMFRNLVEEFSRLSSEVVTVYGMIRSVSAAVGSITEKFQYEDLLRQDLEKTIYAALAAADEEECRRIADAGGDDPARISECLMRLAQGKFSDVGSDVLRLGEELSTALADVRKVLHAFDTVIGDAGAEVNGNENSAEALVLLVEKLDWMKTEFSSYIGNVIKSKYDLSESISAMNREMKGFGEFFAAILGISHQFQTILLMTRIELARYDSLKALLGGTLSDVGSIPVDIRRVIEELMPLYEDVMSSLGGSAVLYRERFDEQRRTLDGCIDAMQKVSLQIYESRKYHGDFLNESGGCSARVRNFLDGEAGAIGAFSEAAGDLLHVPAPENGKSGSGGTEKSVKEYYSPGAASGDYRSMMLVSLISEAVSEKADAGGTIDFF